jgi:hypothetical protein
MYKIVEYSDNLDLTEFYRLASERGFYNNNSKEVLYDTFSHCERFQTWILFYNERAVGSVSSHSLEELGILGDAYRIAARTCVFTDISGKNNNMRSLERVIKQHQNLTAQIFIPLCIEWAGRDRDLYISSNENAHGTQRLVHNIFCPALNSTGALDNPIELEYRLSLQSFWKLNVDVFYNQLKEGQWNEAKFALQSYLGYTL